MGTKANPGPIDCYAAAEDDEPIFVLLARDPVAPAVLRHWASLRAALSLPGSVDYQSPQTEADRRQIQSAYDIAYDMEEWRRKNR